MVKVLNVLSYSSHNGRKVHRACNRTTSLTTQSPVTKRKDSLILGVSGCDLTGNTTITK